MIVIFQLFYDDYCSKQSPPSCTQFYASRKQITGKYCLPERGRPSMSDDSLDVIHRAVSYYSRKHQRHRSTSREVAGSILDCATGIFHWHNPSGRTMTMGSTHPLTEMSTRNISWGGKGGRCGGLTTLPPSCSECLVLFCSEVQWSEVLKDKFTTCISVTLYRGYWYVLWLLHWMCIWSCGFYYLICFVMCGFSNVCVFW